MASIRMVLRKKVLSDGTFPICLRVTIDRKSKYFTALYSADLSEWNEKLGQFKNNSKYLQQNRVLLKIKDRAFTVYSVLKINNENFTLGDFENAFRLTANPLKKGVFGFWREVIEELNFAGRTGSARIHGEAYSALKRFTKKSELEFSNINATFLSKFESFLRSCGGVDGGISIRMRSIRTLFNIAIKRDIITSEVYPFKKYQISKLKAGSAKRALDFNDVMKIVNLDIAKYPHLLQSHKYFVFSFYTRGMNFADQMLLEWRQINGNKIFYTRSKSKGNFNITILPPIRNILDYFKKNSIDTKYVFPILLKDNMTPIQIEYRKHKTLRKYNQDLKEIGKICKINKQVTSYVARHSFANCLKQKGVPTDIISESLGHQNLAVTQAYLKELDSSVLDEASALLL